MTITQKILGIAFIASLAIAYIAGHKSISNNKTDTTETDHTKTTIITIKEPNGTTKTTTTIDDKKNKDTISIIPIKTQKTNISAIIAEDFKHKDIPLYGISFTREFIGPVTLGAFGLTNGTIGLSVGVSF